MKKFLQIQFFSGLPIAAMFMIMASCHGSKVANSESVAPDSSANDSIRQAHKIDSLSKTLLASNFGPLYHNEYSIDFDSILNKRVFIIDYLIMDIQKEGKTYFVKLSIWHRAQIRLKIDSININTLRKADIDNLPVLVFEITKVKKVDLKVSATVDDDNDDSDQNAEKTASLEIKPAIGRGYFIINGELLSIIKK